jgi:GNAT superfamily N-acetyltransferase
MAYERRRGTFLISTDRSLIQPEVVHGFLTGSYWAAGVPREVVERSIEHSLVFGVYEGATQVGFARLITDYTTFAYLADVFILETWRGRGLGTWLAQTIVEHPELQGLRRWLLATRDAHALYEKVGFTPLVRPERWMERPGVTTDHRPRTTDE